MFAYILQPVSSQPRGSQKSRRKCGKEKTRYQLKHCVNFFEGDVMKCVGIGVILLSSDFRDQSDRSKDPTTDENFPTTTQSAFVFFQVDFLRSITHPLLSEFVS